MSDVRKKQVRIGLVGAGFMGRCHANAFRSVGGIFDLPVEPVAEMLADVDEAAADRNATGLGYARATGDWRKLVSDPNVDIVSVTAPNKLHEPIVLTALANGKTVYCEKPLSTSSSSALRMAEAAEAAGALTLVGFNFLCNPMIELAKNLIDGGEIGEVTGFRGRHAENYMASPDTPHSFRTDPQGGGAVADIGSHIISQARYLVGPVAEVTAESRTIFKTRPVDSNGANRAPVAVDDVTHGLLRFENGILGSFEANWAATGRTMDLSWEISGTKGAIAFSQEHMNELHLYRAGGERTAGFTRIEAGPDHPPYGQFCPAPGHHLGFNDLKVIEVAKLLQAYSVGGRCYPDFREAYEVQRTIDAIQASARSGQWQRAN
jgi:predicted dehydrogenase